MKKIVKTTEEVKRDELVMTMRKRKDTLTAAIKETEAWQMAQDVLPTGSQEYKDTASSLAYSKWDVVHAMRDYEDTRKELCAHCSTYNLAGNTFVPAIELVKSVCYYRHN